MKRKSTLKLVIDPSLLHRPILRPIERVTTVDSLEYPITAQGKNTLHGDAIHITDGF